MRLVAVLDPEAISWSADGVAPLRDVDACAHCGAQFSWRVVVVDEAQYTVLGAACAEKKRLAGLGVAMRSAAAARFARLRRRPGLRGWLLAQPAGPRGETMLDIYKDEPMAEWESAYLIFRGARSLVQVRAMEYRAVRHKNRWARIRASEKILEMEAKRAELLSKWATFDGLNSEALVRALKKADKAAFEQRFGEPFLDT